MNKLMKDMAVITALGTVGYCAYSWMSPTSKKRMSKEMSKTASDIRNVKEDMTDMAGTIKDTF